MSYGRRSPRFEAGHNFVLVHAGERLTIRDVSDTGMRLAVRPEDDYRVGDSAEFQLLVRDATSVEGWTLHAVCQWIRDGEAGFRFVPDADFSREMFGRLVRMLSAGETRVVNGTEQ